MPDTATAAASARRTRTILGPETLGLLQRIEARHDNEARAGVLAWQLAPTIPIYLALMRGEAVPLDQLNPDAVQRHGFKGKAA